MSYLGIRWTIGDVSEVGFEALRLSICGAWNLFGRRAQYAVCVNTVPVSRAIEAAGSLPCTVQWLDTNDFVPAWLRDHVAPHMAEGVAWKFAPVRAFPELHELSLDNDVILWRVPEALKDWLFSENACLMAADIQPAFGQFASMCGDRALNSGIRGVPPDYDLEARLQNALTTTGVVLKSELDEQGLQAAVLLESKLLVIGIDEVSICSPFPNHQHHLGKCGAHFVGLNAKHLPWTLEGRGAHELIRERWRTYRDEVARLVTNSFKVAAQ